MSSCTPRTASSSGPGVADRLLTRCRSWTGSQWRWAGGEWSSTGSSSPGRVVPKTSTGWGHDWQRPDRWSCAGGGRPTPLTFVAFDVLHLDGADLTVESYDVRRRVLKSLALSARSWCTVASYRCDGAELLAACAELDIEGVVAKRVASRYRPGNRSRDWIKVKTSSWREQHAPRRREVARY